MQMKDRSVLKVLSLRTSLSSIIFGLLNIYQRTSALEATFHAI